MYKNKQLNCLCCIRDINEDFLKGLLEYPVGLNKIDIGWVKSKKKTHRNTKFI
jgi:hypothetical protein